MIRYKHAVVDGNNIFLSRSGVCRRTNYSPATRFPTRPICFAT